MNSFAKRSCVFILILLSISLFTYSSNAQNSVAKSKVILIDDANGQFINSSLLTGAINSLKSEGFQVLPLTTTIGQETLNGVDLVIIPNPSKSLFSDTQIYYLHNWISNNKDKGIIMLSNPLNFDNSSLNGHGNVFNGILQSTAFSLQDQFVVGQDSNGVLVEKYNSTNSISYLQLNVNSSIPLPGNFTGSVDTISTSLSLASGKSILTAGFDSFAYTSSRTYSSQDSNIDLFGGLQLSSGRIVLGGSTLMFSDLPNPYATNKTWFQSNGNSAFFDSLVKWSLNIASQTVIPTVSSEFYINLSLIAGSFGLFLVVVGIFLYATGKEMKIFEIDQDFLQSQAKQAQEDQTSLTKSQKRLMQRKGK